MALHRTAESLDFVHRSGGHANDVFRQLPILAITVSTCHETGGAVAGILSIRGARRTQFAPDAGDCGRPRGCVRTSKRTNSPLVARRSLGITKFKCATIAEARCARWGARMFACLPIVGPKWRAGAIIRRFSQTHFSVVADDATAIRALVPRRWARPRGCLSRSRLRDAAHRCPARCSSIELYGNSPAHRASSRPLAPTTAHP